MANRKLDLDQFVIDVELLLISVVQGLALAALAADAGPPLSNIQIEYWPYIGSAIIAILYFWSQAISHTLHYVRWPFDLGHGFLYFVVAFFEVVLFGQLADPLRWYGFSAVFFVVVWLLYWYDSRVMSRLQQGLVDSKERRTLAHSLAEVREALRFFVPLAIIFNLIVFLLIWRSPDLLLAGHLHVLAGLGQFGLGLFVLWRSLRRFSERQNLLDSPA